jgi:ankyrin repeat protein
MRFLLAELHLASLAGKRSPKALRSALQKLPTGSDAYDNAYKEAMERISSQNRGSKELALQTLSWITCAKRQLTVSELQHALAVETGTSELDEDNITDIEQVASVCAGLVTVDNESRIVRLAHYTTQEYFERAWQSHFPNAQVEIAEACLTYISFDTFEAGPCVSSKALRMRLQSHPLYSYSAQNWGHHVRSMNTNISVDHVLYEFLLNESKVYASAQVIPDYGKAWSLFEYDRSPSEGDIEDRRQVTALHLVAIFGISSAVRHLLNSGSPRDSKDCHLRSPLSWAAEKGHKDMVKLLLEDGRVRVDSRDKNDRTPLHYACRWGSRESVEILTGFGADPGTADNRDRRTPLELAVKHGHEPVVEYLLDLCKVQVNSRNSSGETLLTIAARRGHAQIIKLLLRYGSADLCDRFDWTAIIYAAVYGLIRVVDILLGGQAYKDVFGVHVACGWDHTPLSNATIGGHYSAGERLLVYARVNPDATDFSNRTPLSHAAGGGHHMIVESLLRFTDVDPNARDWTGWTPLMWSAKHGHAAVTALLLSDDRTDPNVRNIENQTPLSVASQWGHISVMELLLKNNAVEVDNKDNSGRTPLQQASEQGEFFVVDLLLRSGARPNHQDKHGATCLSLAAQHGHQFVVQQLLNTEQVNPDFQDKDGRTPLSWAAEGGHKSVVQQLLDTKQVNPDSRDKDGGNPLLWAVENRRQSVVAPLTIAGADTRVPLVKAAGNGCQSTVAAFIEAGADLNIIDDQCKSPLQAAINNGYYDMVRMLVKAGANVEYGTFSSFERKVIGGMRKRHRTA